MVETRQMKQIAESGDFRAGLSVRHRRFSPRCTSTDVTHHKLPHHHHQPIQLSAGIENHG
jgi:hypothetical protein